MSLSLYSYFKLAEITLSHFILQHTYTYFIISLGTAPNKPPTSAQINFIIITEL